MTHGAEDSQARRWPLYVSLPILLTLLAGCPSEEVLEDTAGAFFVGEGPDGQRLIVRKPPVRIVAANVCAAEMVKALVPQERIAGIPETVFTGFAIGFEDRSRWADDQVFRRYRGEDVLGLRPDLVVAHTHQDQDTTRLLRSDGLPVLQLRAITSFSDITETIRLLGQVLGEKVKAESLARSLEERRRRLEKPRKRRLRILSYTNYGTGGWTQGARSTANIVITLAGHVNAAATGHASENHFGIDLEQIASLRPDVFLVGVDPDGRSPGRSVLEKSEALKGLPAIRKGRIVSLPTTLWTSSSHHLMDAAEALAAAVDELR